MIEDPPRPKPVRRKKPAPASAAPLPEPEPQPAPAPEPEPPQAEAPRTDAALKEAVLAAALPQAAFDGFSDKVLQAAGKEAGLGKADLMRLFPEGPLGLMEYYSHSVDAEMEKRLAALDLPSMKIRARIAAAITARLSVLKPHKEAARRAAALLSLPVHAGLAAKLLYRSVDLMWRAAGDTATDFNFYTKRGILAGSMAPTLVRWFNDTSEGETATSEFLAARIENVMQFEKFKAQAKDALAGLPAFANIFKRP